MRERPCPRCQSLVGFRANGFTDSGICNACDQVSTSCEISRGKPWTEAEIAQMLKVTR